MLYIQNSFLPVPKDCRRKKSSMMALTCVIIIAIHICAILLPLICPSPVGKYCSLASKIAILFLSPHFPFRNVQIFFLPLPPKWRKLWRFHFYSEYSQEYIGILALPTQLAANAWFESLRCIHSLAVPTALVVVCKGPRFIVCATLPQHNQRNA